MIFTLQISDKWSLGHEDSMEHELEAGLHLKIFGHCNEVCTKKVLLKVHT